MALSHGVFEYYTGKDLDFALRWRHLRRTARWIKCITQLQFPMTRYRSSSRYNHHRTISANYVASGWTCSIQATARSTVTLFIRCTSARDKCLSTREWRNRLVDISLPHILTQNVRLTLARRTAAACQKRWPNDVRMEDPQVAEVRQQCGAGRWGHIDWCLLSVGNWFWETFNWIWHIHIRYYFCRVLRVDSEWDELLESDVFDFIYR